ncbi:hypothetical protein V8B97DRAFT_1373516 [Scleroderma yunnanense]
MRVPFVKFADFLSVTSSYSVVPSLIRWIANNSAWQATSITTGFIASNFEDILATWLPGSLFPVPNYIIVTVTSIIMSMGLVILSTVNLCYLQWQNRMKAKKRLTSVKGDGPETLGGRSAMLVCLQSIDILSLAIIALGHGTTLHLVVDCIVRFLYQIDEP